MTRRLALGLLLALSGCASRAPDVGQRAQGITGGVLDADHSGVFLFVEHDGMFAGVCTATLIAPNLLLTAHHCVVGQLASGGVECGVTSFGSPLDPTSFEASNAESANGTGNISFYRAQKVDVPPGGDGCGYDLALVTLSSVVPASVAVPTVPRVDRRTSAGETYTAVGYGEDSAGNGTGDRHRLAGLQVICTPGSCGAPVYSSEFVGGDGVCEGDSGSPALDADGKVMGVLSRGGPVCTTPIYGSVAAWSDWIIGVAQTAAQSGGYPPPFWIDGQSDPLGAGGSGAGGGGAGGSGGGASGSSGASASGAAGSAGAATGGFAGSGSTEQGSACTKQADCTGGFHCFSPTGETTNAFCAADCAQQACGSGFSCYEASHVCLPVASAAAHDSGSCAFGRTPSRDGSSGVVGLLLLAALAGARRLRAQGALRAQRAAPRA